APDELRRLGALGEKVGMAFQITDDVLDYVGQPDKTGKPPAQDLKERKVTLPLLKALERSTPEERQLVDSFLRSTSGDSGADRILEIVRRRGGAEAALDEARRFQRQARSLLNSFQPGPHRSALAALIDFVVDREN
ncbi:MAG: polyprenyl synthetase family protein, partial [candidate division KSB1 bacterium]|nr:polyprenyl synthetase family protein [candidate division KSB1 bacterium]